MSQIQVWIETLIENYGYISLFILMIVENVFPPIPSEVILTFAGFMTCLTYLTIPGVVIVATLGSFLGSFILYFLGRLISIERLETLLDSQLARRLHFHKESVHKTQDWFLKHGKTAVFFGRLVPMIRSLISIPAGMTKMPVVSYSLYTLFGTLFWDILLVVIGRLLGSQWHLISFYMQRYDYAWKIILILFIIYFIIKKKKS